MNDCPQCGKQKPKRSALCRRCYDENRGVTRYYSKSDRVCPSCGGYKYVRATTCRPCSSANLVASCQRCGGTVKVGEKICRGCVRREQTKIVPPERFLPIVDRFLASFDYPARAHYFLSSNSARHKETWGRLLRDWRAHNEALPFTEVDEFLTAAHLTHLWWVELADIYEAAA